MGSSKKQYILLLTVICCASLALISIAFAALSSTLKLSGQASVAAQSWDIDFTNTVGTKWTTAQSLTGTKTNLAELPTSSSGAFSLPVDQTASGYLGLLRMSGDKITYTWYVQNFGTFEAKYSISGLIKTDSYASGSNVDITCNTSDNSTDKTFCNNYVKTTLTIDGVVASPTDSYTLAKAGQTGDSSILVLTIEIIGENQIYTATAGAFENRYSNTNPSMLSAGIEMLDSSNDLNISVTGLSLSGTQSVVQESTTSSEITTEGSSIAKNTEYLYDYTGKEETFTAESTGTYKLELWGAQGGSWDTTTHGGYGAYAVGQIKLSKGDILYLNVGGVGTGDQTHVVRNGGYNGGGNAIGDGDGNTRQASGGGASSIAKVSGELKTLEAYKGTLSSDGTYYISGDIIIVAAGGGGAGVNSALGALGENVGGAGGGIKGNYGNAFYIGYNFEGYGGTQTSAGTGYYASGSFGLGASSVASGGGGGFYGGGGGHYGSGGGSSYIANALLSNKAMYCYNCEESNVENTKTISTTDVSDTAISNYAKKGSGFIKITYLG